MVLAQVSTHHATALTSYGKGREVNALKTLGSSVAWALDVGGERAFLFKSGRITSFYTVSAVTIFVTPAMQRGRRFTLTTNKNLLENHVVTCPPSHGIYLKDPKEPY